MNQLRINKDLVTHIKIYDSKIVENYRGEKYKHLKAHMFKFLWFIPAQYYEEGYYRNGVYDTWYCNDGKDIRYKDVDGFLWINVRVEIFAQKELITTEYFNSLEEAKEYCNTNFPNVNFYVGKD